VTVLVNVDAGVRVCLLGGRVVGGWSLVVRSVSCEDQGSITITGYETLIFCNGSVRVVNFFLDCHQGSATNELR
jgi:hypothetical protein